MRRRELSFLVILCCILTFTDCILQSDSNYYFFRAAESTSTLVGTSYNGEYDAVNALTPSSSEWRSASGLTSDQQVIFMANIPATARVIGIKIIWSFSPKETQIQISPDGINYHIAIPFRHATQNLKEYTEDFIFDHSQDLKAIKIQMRGNINEFIGIRQIVAIGNGSPLAMIISGITDPKGDNCLQVSGGRIQQEFAPVELDSCVYGIAAGDGRELWRIRPNGQIVSALSNPPKCLAVANGDLSHESPLVIQDCELAEQAQDGRSYWDFNDFSQLRVKGTNACIYQKNVVGNSVGVTILHLNGTASSVMDALHLPESAFDGDVATYWVSAAFDDASEHRVAMDLSTGNKYEIRNIRIDWEFPPISYAIVSNIDGRITEVTRVEGNPLNITLNDMGGITTSHIRIIMEKPHPRYGKFSGKYLYGIREVEVLTNNLNSVITFCKDAATSSDARDKYFLNYVEEFNAKASDMVKSAARDVLSRTRNLGSLSDRMNILLPSVEECYSEKRDYLDRLEEYRSEAKRLTEELEVIQVDSTEYSENRQMGDVFTIPAEDCYAIAAKNPSAVSGFYWILPRCAPEPLRVWCDIKHGASYYIWNNNATPGMSTFISSVSDIRRSCSQVGLEPLVVHSAEQIANIRIALNKMGFKMAEGSGIPLAVDYGCNHGKCSGSFQDLNDGSNDLSSLVLSLASPESTATSLFGNDAVGLGFSENYLSFFDLKTSDIVGIVCSTNVLLSQKQINHVDIDCNTIAYKNPIFEGPINTNIVVQCPPGCLEYDTPVFGNNGLYSEKSSVCRAAIHFGVISSEIGGIFSVGLEGPKNSFDGSLRNSIDSKSIAGSPNRSLRVGPIAKDCPIDIFSKSPTAFYQVGFSNTLQDKKYESLHIETILHDKQSFIKRNMFEIVNANPYIADILREASNYIDESYGIDPLITTATQEQSMVAAAELKKRLKPVESLVKSQSPKILDVVNEVDDIANDLLKVTGIYQSILKELIDKLDDVESIHSSQIGFQSFKLDYKEMPFEHTFLVYDMPRTQRGPSDWGYTTTPINGRSKVLGQNSPISGYSNHSPRGTYVQVKYRRFFDFDFSVDVYPPISGVFGIGFRIRDFSNMYLLEFNQEEEIVRLIRMKDGITYILDDQSLSLKEKEFSTIKIIAQRDRIYISIGNVNIKVLDEGLLSGTIGFYSNGVAGGVYFDNIEVRAMPCKKFFFSSAPRSPRCSNFKQCYLSTLESTFDTKDQGDNWKYKKVYKGRANVLMQSSLLDTIIMLKESHTCKDGYFSFDFYPTCGEGVVYGIFRYLDRNSYYKLEIRHKETKLLKQEDGYEVQLALSRTGFSLDKWNTILINFEKKAIYIYKTSYNDDNELLFVANSNTTNNEHGRIGIGSSNCANVAFDHLSIKPFYVNIKNDHSGLKQENEESIYSFCIGKRHTLERKEHCETIFYKSHQKASSCSSNYCSTCCNFYTNILDKKYYNNCNTKCSEDNLTVEDSVRNHVLLLAKCLSGTGKSFDLCSEKDNSCAKNICDLCCESSTSNMDVDIRRAVVSDCQAQCYYKFGGTNE
ncbi:hypothetical protein ACR3K2_02030 [Cryptosporidium serpentis]